MKLQELYDKRANLVKQQRDILDKAKAEKREMTADETTSYETLDTDYGKVLDQIRDAEKERDLSNREKELAEERENYTPTRLDMGGGDRQSDQDKPFYLRGEYHNAFFDGFARRGKANLSPQHFNALEEGTASEGGYLVPEEWERNLIKAMAEINVVRRLAKARSSRLDKNLPVRASRATFTWIDEEGTYSKNDPAYGNITMGAHKVGGIILVSEELAQDNTYNLAGELRLDAAEEFAFREEAAFVSGDGSGKPTGIFATTAVAGVSVTGKQGATNATPVVTTDDLIDTFYGLKRQYRSRASWLTGDAIAKLVRKVKDNDGQYIWAPGLTAGEPDRLLGRPFYTSDSSPTPAAEGKSIVFADFSYYNIFDRLGMTMQVLRELYAETGQIGYKFMKRTEGKMTLAEAMTFYQHGAAA